MHLPSDSNYIDVSPAFAQSVHAMAPGRVALVPNFDMLEGARALEVGNAKLDTGAIALTPAQLHFDTAAPQPLAAVVALMDRLVVLYMTWLDGHALSVSVLSCRYMVDLMASFQTHRVLARTGFGSARLAPANATTTANTSSTDPCPNVNVLLRAFALAVAKTVGLSTRVAAEVLYDEEDLVTRTMGFDFLGQVSSQMVVAELAAAERWLAGAALAPADAAPAAAAAVYLRLARGLVSLEAMLAADVRLFDGAAYADANVAQALAAAEQLRDTPPPGAAPAAATSTFVQLDCANKHIPAANVCMDRAAAYGGLVSLLGTLAGTAADLASVRNASQLEAYLRLRVATHTARAANALARGFFQLFLIRDDRSIMGSADDVASLGMRLRERVSVCGNTLMDPPQWAPHGGVGAAACLDKVSQLVGELDAYTYQKLSVCGNNRSRQRQLNNRLIVLLDSLQFLAENTEAELFAHGIGDRLSPTSPQPALGVTSWVYLEKLDVMVDVVLSGFEQDIYRPAEAALMWWYAADLYAHAHQHVSGRLVELNEGKLAQIRVLAKKVKKAKGAQRAALQATHDAWSAGAAVLAANVGFFKKYLAPEKLAAMDLCSGLSVAVDVMEAVAKPRDTRHFLASEEQLFRLRMKPWSSVGTPEIPRYEAYRQKRTFCTEFRSLARPAQTAQLKYQTALATVHLAKCKDLCRRLLANMDDRVLRDRLEVNGENLVEANLRGMVATVDQYLEQLRRIDLDKTYRMVCGEGALHYFPYYSLQEEGAPGERSTGEQSAKESSAGGSSTGERTTGE